MKLYVCDYQKNCHENMQHLLKTTLSRQYFSIIQPQMVNYVTRPNSSEDKLLRFQLLDFLSSSQTIFTMED